MKYTPFKRKASNPYWDLVVKPKSAARYDPTTFHVRMWNPWTNKVCEEHQHKVTKATKTNIDTTEVTYVEPCVTCKGRHPSYESWID